MSTRTDQIVADGGQAFSAYVSLPDRPNGRAIVVVQEIFGVTPHVRDVADRYARDGYLAIAPDLFWRIEPDLSLTHSKEDLQRAFAVLEKFDEDLGVEDLGKTVAHARHQPGITGVGLVGMCLGGKLAYLAAARLDVDACISFYGVGIEKNLDEAGDIKRPLLMFFGGKDRYAPPDVRARIEAATAGNGQTQVKAYEEADHGFYTRGAPEVIASSHREATAFLAKHLPGPGAAQDSGVRGVSTCFEAVDVGGRWTSTGRTLTEADLTFACMTSGDWHPIHADAVFAGTSLAGRRIFQGSYGVHLAVALAAPFPDMGDDLIGALGFSDWRYVAPLCIGDTVHVDVEIAAKRMSSKPGRGILEKRITLIKADGSVAQQGTTQMMVRCSTEAA